MAAARIQPGFPGSWPVPQRIVEIISTILHAASRRLAPGLLREVGLKAAARHVNLLLHFLLARLCPQAYFAVVT
jgi:hypothetical protein